MLKFGVLLFLFLIPMVSAGELHSPPRFVSRLIHINSVHSPFYNPEHSNEALADMYLHGSLSNVLLHSSQHFGSISAPLSPLPSSGFLVHLKVGQHRADQYLFLDTGSNILWIHCRPDSLYARNPVYDSKRSSTYQAEDCRTSDFCNSYGYGNKCDLSNRCEYHVAYGKGIASMGHFARETFVFGSSLFGRDEIILDDILFGCSNVTRLPSDGILGLGNNKFSLLTQTSSSRFSYCLGDITDPRYDYNQLIIGNPIKDRLTHVIPMTVHGKYFIDITDIEIGGVLLDLDTNILKRNVAKETGGMVVDTGVTLTYFFRVVYTPFATAIRNLIDHSSLHRYEYYDPSRLCYHGRFRRDLAGFPIVRFWFGKSAYMEFRTGSLFEQVGDGAFCLAFKVIEDLGGKFDYGILGILLQQGYYISYDLQASTFSFETMDCSAAVDDIHDEL